MQKNVLIVPGTVRQSLVKDKIMSWQKAILLIIGMIVIGVALFIVVYCFIKPKGRFRKKKNIDIIKVKKFEYFHFKDCANYKRREKRRKR